MAEQKVQFTIGSIFQGEGFKQARQAIVDTNNGVKKAMNLCSQLASTVGMMDASYARATSAITGLLAAISSGNPILIATQVAVTGITAVLDILKSSYDETAAEAEKAYQRVKTMRDALVKSFNKSQQDDMELFIGHLSRIEKQFDDITKSVNGFKQALNKLDQSFDTEDILQMRIDAFKQTAGRNDADVALDKAKSEYAIVLQENANNEKYAQQKIDAANTKREDAEKKIALIEEETAKINEKRQEILKELNSKGKIDISIQEQLTKNLEDLSKKQKELDEQRFKADDEVISANRELAQAEQDFQVQLKKNELARLEAEQKVTDTENQAAYDKHEAYMAFIKGCQEQIEQMEQIRKQEQDDADKKHKVEEQLRKALEQNLKEEEQRLNDAKKQLGHGSSGGGGGGGWGDNDHPSERQRQTSRAWNTNNQARAGILDAINKFYEAGGGNRIDRRLNLQDKSIQQKVGETAKQQALNQGMSLAAANKAGRDAARAARDAASSKEGRQAAQDAKRLNDLQKKVDSGKKLSPKEEQELKDLERQKAGKEADIERAKQEAENIQNLPNNVKELKKAVNDIKTQLEKLGLK